MVLAFFTFCIGPLSIYPVSFHFLPYFQRYAPDKHSIAKLKRGSYSVNTGDRVKVLHSAILLQALYTDGRRTFGRRTFGRTDKAATICSPFGEFVAGPYGPFVRRTDTVSQRDSQTLLTCNTKSYYLPDTLNDWCIDTLGEDS